MSLTPPSSSQSQSQDNAATFGLDIRPIGGRLGAEVHGVRLSGDLQPATVKAIHQAVLKYKALFFPKQTHLDDAGQEAFGRLFGKLIPHPTVPGVGGTEAILEVDGSRGERASSWHADFTFVAEYSRITILRGAVVPKSGGDTVFANTVAAYNELPEPLRDLADKVWALHSNDFDYVGDRTIYPQDHVRFRDVFTSTVYETEHPLVHVHPETGERSLILGHFIDKLIGFGSSDSARLLAIFNDHATRPENTVRWRWSEGDVAVWDNRATLHRAVDDYGDQPRVVRRSTVWGEAPVSVDGRRSVTRVAPKRASAAA
jgi:taurine dioxygenase